MSQAGRFANGSGGMVLETLTGDIGGPVGPDGAFNINILGGNHITTTGNPGTNTITIDLDTDITENYVTDNGTAIPAGGILNVLGGVTSPETVENINTYADPNGSNNLKIALNNTIFWPNTNGAGTQGVIYLNAIRFMHNFSSFGGNPNATVFLGQRAGNFTNSADSVIAIGQNAMSNVTNADGPIAIGGGAFNALTTGDHGIAIGRGAASVVTTGQNNYAIGRNAAWRLVTGADNIIIGGNLFVAGSLSNRGADAYTGAENGNIIIGNRGVVGESSTIRIGTSGAWSPGIPNQNRCFIAGIFNTNPAGASGQVVIADDQGQLGTVGSMAAGQLVIGTNVTADPVVANLTAGAGISIANGSGSITISATGSDILAYTSVNSSPYVVLSTDEFLGVDCSIIPITIQLPNAPTTGQVFYIKDSTGNANTNNISVTTVGGVVTIDGVTTYTMNTQFSAISVIFNGTSYEIF